MIHRVLGAVARRVAPPPAASASPSAAATPQPPRLDDTDFWSGLGDSAWLLYALTRAMKPDVAVEIGSARGKSACYVGTALRENGRGTLYAIDPHRRTDWNDLDSVDTYPIITRHLELYGVQEQVRLLRQASEEAAATWTTPIDLLFIDGDHSYEGVKRDWALFTPFVRSFGVVVFHDTLWDVRPDPKWPTREDMGVPRFVDELRRDGYPVVTLDRDFGVSVVQPVRGGEPLGPVAGGA